MPYNVDPVQINEGKFNRIAENVLCAKVMANTNAFWYKYLFDFNFFRWSFEKFAI